MLEQFHPVDLEAGARSPEQNGRRFYSSDHSRSASSFSATSSASGSVFQVPKTAILKEAPKERTWSNKKHYRLRQHCSFCRILSWLILAIFLFAAVLAILYLVYRPTVPSYSIDSLYIKSLNLEDPVYASPEFDVFVRAENNNKKVGMFYENGSFVSISYSGEQLVSGKIPVFYQGPRNVTVFPLVLTGSNVRLSSAIHQSLIQGVKDGNVPLLLSLNVPLRLKFGAVKTWKFTVKVRCDTIVDKLTADSKIFSNSCKYTIDL